MRTSFKVLSVSAALASMAVCLPTEFFKRDVATLVKCFTGFVVNGEWGTKCQAAVALPGLMPSSEFKLLRLDFTADGDFPLASAEIMTNLIPIPTIILPMAQIKYKVAMSFNGGVVGTIDTPFAEVSADASALTTIMAPVPLVVETTAQADFAAFVKAIVASESVPIPLEGKADISFNIKPFLASQASVKVVSGIGYQTTTVFPGLKGLPDIKFVSLIANTPDADKKTQTISFKVNINVASNLSVKLGDVEFNAAGPAGPIGTTTFKALTLAHGDNTTVVDLSLAGAADFVSGLSTADATLTLTGFAGSTTNPLTVTAVEALKLTVVIPKQSTPAA
ncbi:hypothetical protein BGZ74_006621 [Mortierella antarctica]|nr:hypothetical protein BGZ74_006621 [Mortierella antarctica]